MSREEFAQTVMAVLEGPIIDGQQFQCEDMKLHDGRIEATLVCDWEPQRHRTREIKFTVRKGMRPNEVLAEFFQPMAQSFTEVLSEITATTKVKVTMETITDD